MRILFLCVDFSVLSQTFVYDRVKGLSARGHAVHVATIKRSMITERPFEPVTVLTKSDVIRRNLGKIAASSPVRRTMSAVGLPTNATPYSEMKFQHSLDQLVKNIKPDYIHAEFGKMGVLANEVALRNSLPLVVFMHGYDITQLPAEKIWHEAYQQLWRDGVNALTPSEFMRGKVIALGARPQSVFVQENGVDIGKWQFSDPAERYHGGQVSFLFVGRLVEKKGPRQLVEAFAAMRKQAPGIDARLTICGEGPLEVDVKRDIERLGLGGSVDLLGACSNDEIRDHMKRAHIAILPSVTAASGDMEGLPVVLTEAAASGLPLIATRHSGIPEIVYDGVNGLLVEENDIAGLAAKMAELAQTPALWSSFARAGRKIVEQKFSQDVALDKYEALIRERVLRAVVS